MLRIRPVNLALLGIFVGGVWGGLVLSAAPIGPTLESDGPRTPYLPLSRTEALLDGCFATGGACAVCHSASPWARAMRDSRGENIAPHDLWQGTMMANASRDPLWRAMVSAEVARTPTRRAEIESKCMRCHTPMAAVEADHAGDQTRLEELYSEEARRQQLALDAVSCTVCHQISAAGLGDPASFSGRFRIGSKQIYGPHERPFVGPMRNFTGFTPTHGEHVLRSELCATCHTLETESWDRDGTANGHVFLEQAPYLEWRSSRFARTGDPMTCQSCHMPRFEADGTPTATAIARNPGGRDFPPIGERSPFGRHLFVGGNTLTPALLRDHRETLRPPATDAALNATIAAARSQLRSRTAAVAVEAVSRRDRHLDFTVRVENRTGHKFPTAHPMRRAWLQVRVTDATGGVWFESGLHDAQGRILDGSGDVHAAERAGGPLFRHRGTVSDPDQVQVYEAIMADGSGQPTWSLVRAARWHSDRRLLPPGAASLDPRIVPVGTEGDPDFGPGGDRVRFRVGEIDTAEALVIEAALLYQTLGSRFAAELLRIDTPETRELAGYLRSADLSPRRVAGDRIEVPSQGRVRERF